MTKSGAERLLDLYKYGFWVRTKQAPHRAVRWERQRREDGRESFHGKNWVEVLPHGTDLAFQEGHEAERFYTADVEYVGPNEWLDYYPAVDEPVCGWGKPHGSLNGPMRYCPRFREEGAAFCRVHLAELSEERNLDGEDQSGAGGKPVPVAE